MRRTGPSQWRGRIWEPNSFGSGHPEDIPAQTPGLGICSSPSFAMPCDLWTRQGGGELIPYSLHGCGGHGVACWCVFHACLFAHITPQTGVYKECLSGKRDEAKARTLQEPPWQPQEAPSCEEHPKTPAPLEEGGVSQEKLMCWTSVPQPLFHPSPSAQWTTIGYTSSCPMTVKGCSMGHNVHPLQILILRSSNASRMRPSRFNIPLGQN